MAEFSSNKNVFQKRIAAFRTWMKEEGLAAFILADRDPMGSEYPAEHYRVRSFISGFDGSNGTLVITADEVLLWTDARYFIQAEQQLAGIGGILMQEYNPRTPTVNEWLCEHLPAGATVGIDGEVFSVKDLRELREECEPAGLHVKMTTNIIAGLPPLPLSKAFVHERKYAGESVSNKLMRTRDAMREAGANATLIRSLDSVCWLFNIRGADVPCCPVVYASALVTENKAFLFIDHSQVNETVRAHLEEARVRILDSAAQAEILAQAASENSENAGFSLLFDPETVNASLFESFPASATLIEAEEPTRALKAIKNRTEIENLRRACEKDGRAMVRFLIWLEENAGEIDEYDVSQKLTELRAEEPLCLGDSFPPICGYMANGALAHYQPQKETAARIEKRGLLVVDSGGSYLDGTTDLTRTIALGELSPRQKREFTLVLKSHIAFASAQFHHGASGVHIDTLARKPLWDAGLDYNHGTGHGVGFCLNVHEAPPSIAALLEPEHGTFARIEKNMVFSNEPGIYREGEYGIRIENLVRSYFSTQTDFGPFMKLETLTLCPFSLSAIDFSLLDENEKAWLTAYNTEVYERLAPLLSESERSWLRKNTQLP